MDQIIKVGRKYKIPIIEDGAQSILSKYKNKFSGSWGDIGCFSTHPLKNLNAAGDGGFITTNDKLIYNKIKSLRSHGMEENRNNVKNFGFVSRMDNLQASILNYRLKNLKKIIKIRRNNVNIYLKNLDLDKIYFPIENKYQFNTYHTFVIQVKKRDELKSFLKKNGVETAIHYPIPIHLQRCSRFLNFKKGEFPVSENQASKILSLPINQFLKENEILKITKLINYFYKKN
jgi:dTDP-4-amino-4,6-dideoxygalactose transaminase